MSFSSFTLVQLLTVALLSVANGNIFDSLQKDLNKLEMAAETELRREPVDTIRRWTRLSAAAVRHMAVGIPMTLILPQENKQVGKCDDEHISYACQCLN